VDRGQGEIGAGEDEIEISFAGEVKSVAVGCLGSVVGRSGCMIDDQPQ